MKTIRFTLATLVIFLCTLSLWQQNVYAQSSTLLYGITGSGGTADGSGTIFHIDPVTGVQTVDYSFTGAGLGPTCVLAFYNGRFYGVTYNYVTTSFIFEWNPADNTFTHKFDFDYNTMGIPCGNSLTLCGDKFYGTTFEGGPTGHGGILYEWDPATNNFLIKHVFDGIDGWRPWGNNLALYNGKLYGMANSGGSYYGGVIFEYDPVVNLYTKKVDFNPGYGPVDGNFLVLYSGKFYTINGGNIFEWDPLTNNLVTKVNGAPTSFGSMTMFGDKFYYQGEETWGSSDNGIFSWDPVTNIVSKEYVFNAANSDGAGDYNSLTVYDGKLYGILTSGGVYDMGTIYTWDPVAHIFNKLLDFNGPNGASPAFTQLSPNHYPFSCNIAAEAGPDATTYFGIASMQQVARTAEITGGTAPFTYTWTTDRPLLCNQQNAEGDEMFYGGTCTNNTCPTSGPPSGIASCSESATINAILMDTATVCVTVTDANGCTASDCFTVNASDVRCFSASGGNQKTKMCHHSSSNSNPWVEMCVDNNAVDAHLAHGDYIGSCISGSNAPVTGPDPDPEFHIYPNPATNRVTIEFGSATENSYMIELGDLAGRKLNGFQGKAIKGKNTKEINLENFVKGIYLVKVILDGTQEVKKLVIE